MWGSNRGAAGWQGGGRCGGSQIKRLDEARAGAAGFVRGGLVTGGQRKGIPKTALLISSGFPPQTNPASKRTGNLAKYLVELGWQPIVVSPRGPAHRNERGTDPEYVAGIPKEVMDRRVGLEAPRLGLGAQVDDGVRKLLIPHTRPAWYLHTCKAACAGVLESTHVDLIWATAPGLVTFLVGRWAARTWGIPWVADLRDVAGTMDYEGVITRHEQRLLEFFQWRLIASAGEVCTVSQELVDCVRERSGRAARLIPNGFDPLDLVTGSSGPIEKFNILYTGHVWHSGQDFLPLLEAVAQLLEEGKVSESDISFEFYGQSVEPQLKRMVGHHRAYRLIKTFDAVPWRECRDLQRRAAVLLVGAFPGLKGIITSKVFEYLAAGRPILVVPNDHDCLERLMKETASGVAPSSTAELKEQLLSWYETWKRAGNVLCPRNMEAVRRYSRREQARQIVGLFDGLVG